MHLALLLAAAATLPRVDASLVDVDLCGEMAIAFPEERHGWLADDCGHVLESLDGGESWSLIDPVKRGLPAGMERGPINRFVWPSPSVGLGLFYGSNNAVRTQDGGKSWSGLKLPGEVWTLYVENADEHIWACTMPGKIIRSDDAGATWREVANPSTEARRCPSLHFVDGKDGWAIAGALFKTNDGGDTWQPMIAPTKDVARAARYSAKVGWVGSRDNLFVTTDGGAHWTQVERRLEEGKPYLTRIGGRNLITSNRAADPAKLIPAFGGTPWGEAGVVRRTRGRELAPGDLDFIRNGELVRTSPIAVRTGPPQMETLLEVFDARPLGSGGWSAEHFYHSYDGKTWLVSGEMPGKPKRVRAIGDGRQRVAETSQGWFVGSEWEWRRAESPAWAQYQFELAGGGRPKNPLACITTAETGSIDATLIDGGCFQHDEDRFRLAWRRDGSATLTGELKKKGKVEQELGAPQAGEILRSIVEAAEAPEGKRQCGSTNFRMVRLKWTCGPDAQEQTFDSLTCEDASNETVGSDSYSPAAGLSGRMHAALNAAR
jgi:hypothetical protein